MFNSKLFGKTIKAMRKNRKFSLLTQYYLLKKIGIDNEILYNIERNENITLLTLEKLCRRM